MLKVKSKAPSFSLNDQDGKAHVLKDYKGKWVVLYFYPKDNTPGCTKEACSFRDWADKFKIKDVVILGVSVDSEASHKKFEEKYSLPFTLLSDIEKKVVKRYNVWGLKKFMGKEYMGTQRKSFLIDPNGVIVKIYDKVAPEFHAQEVIHDVASFSRG